MGGRNNEYKKTNDKVDAQIAQNAGLGKEFLYFLVIIVVYLIMTRVDLF